MLWTGLGSSRAVIAPRAVKLVFLLPQLPSKAEFSLLSAPHPGLLGELWSGSCRVPGGSQVLALAAVLS